MQELLFYLFAGLTLVFGVLVVANPYSRNPVTSAMFLVLTIISLAGLFVLLHAYFLAAVQILVYAGAVIILFLFIIMLLDIKDEERRKFKTFGVIVGIGAVGGLAALMGSTIAQSGLNDKMELRLYVGDTRALGEALFSQGRFLLPFEIVSVLLLVAMVGVILLSKKDLK
jgi:NADH-quinone oxidoreductase subunit J